VEDPVVALLSSVHDLKPTPAPEGSMLFSNLGSMLSFHDKTPMDWHEENGVADGSEQLDGIDGDKGTADLFAPLLDACGLRSMMTERA
jgi:hypothetical protein